MIYIGIDTGKHTGLAVWDSRKGRLLEVETMPIHRALDRVLTWTMQCSRNGINVMVIFEDARQRKYYTGDVAAKAQGAGSIKRDAWIWEDFLIDYSIPFRAVAPGKGSTKWTAAYFKQVTGWQGLTSNHARDAAVLVIGR